MPELHISLGCAKRDGMGKLLESTTWVRSKIRFIGQIEHILCEKLNQSQRAYSLFPAELLCAELHQMQKAVLSVFIWGEISHKKVSVTEKSSEPVQIPILAASQKRQILQGAGQSTRICACVHHCTTLVTGWPRLKVRVAVTSKKLDDVTQCRIFRK